MPSSRAPTAFAAIFILASLARANPTPVAEPAPQDSVVLNAMTYEGCYSSSNPLTDQGSFQYQTNGHCQPICVGQNQAVLALSGGSDCWCGDQLPPLSNKVDDSQCNVPCQGFGSQMCGGDGFYSVYLSGTTSNVGHVSGGGSGGSSSSSSSSSEITVATAAAETQAPSTTSQAATVVTSVAPGKTVVITQAPSSETQDASASKQSQGSGPNIAGIAAGVVVGILAIVAIVGGIFLWRRHQRRKESEDEYKKTQVSSFIAGGGERKPPGTGWSQMSDSRLDPEAGKRFSNGSIADNNDYSRRILRVANPS